MLTERNYARTAGLLYLVIIVFGISSEVLIRGTLIVTGDAEATAANILASPGLFHLGFVLDALMLLCDVAIAVIFYHLLNALNQTLAFMAAAFRLTQAAVLGFNLLNYYAPFLLLNGIGASAFDSTQLNVLALFFFELHSYGYDLGLLFFALSNFILGYLLIRSSRFPSILGYGLLAAALVYLLGSISRFALPGLNAMMQPAYAIPLVAELAFCLWLLIRGIKTDT